MATILGKSERGEDMNKHTMSDLMQMQSLPLAGKISMTQQRIRAWYDYFDGDVYVSFSGGKDSTVLVDIITKMGYKDIPLVFVDTGLEYPEIREFVKGYGDRVTWLRPKMNFKQVIEKYGYPFISKEVSYDVNIARNYLSNPEEHKNKKPLKVNKCGYYRPYSLEKLEGTLDSKMFNCEKWNFMLEAPFKVSKKCCDVMKKNPVKQYQKETGRMAILATLADESRMRTLQWLKNGCNGFDMKKPVSNPMSFWTEQDVLQYIKQNNLPICSVYGDIVEILEEDDPNVEGQMTISDLDGYEQMSEFDAERPELKLTGLDRTGCMFCGYGCHLEKEECRFERMKKTHPKQYDYIMRPKEEGGLNYKEVIDWINEHGNMNIRY